MDNFSLIAGINLAAAHEEVGNKKEALAVYEQVCSLWLL
jgi:hypothetical protein